MNSKLNPDQKIEGLQEITICDFWSWAYSDVLSNRNRSIFAEFIVGAALDITDNSRVEWDAVDLRYKDFKIEVKSAAYVQSWLQKMLSPIQFDIAKKRPWDALTNEYDDEQTRFSDCYVFCLYAETDYDKADVLNLNSWDFYVVSTGDLNNKFNDQKSIALSTLNKLCDSVPYSDLKKTVDEILGLRSYFG